MAALFRGSYRSCSARKGLLRNFAKFTGKEAQVFSCEFCEISKSTFFTEHVWATASILLASFAAKLELVFVLTHENGKFFFKKLEYCFLGLEFFSF